MLTKSPAWRASDGKAYFTLEEGQTAELAGLFSHVEGKSQSEDLDVEYAKFIVQNKAKIMDILTTSETSRPAARKANGATRKPRTPKPKVVADPDKCQTLPGV